MKLPLTFYQTEDVVGLAKQLLGKVLCTRINNHYTTGLITETEAYAGVSDKASHAYGGRFTERTSVMYGAGGLGYVYLCYGIHNLFNVVTGPKGTPHALLVRGIKPLEGLDMMLERLSKKTLKKNATNGPGKLTKALGIGRQHNAIELNGQLIWIEDRNITIGEEEIISGPRIGVDYAGEDAILPYRFYIKEKATQNLFG